ncbi:conserved hypothetical protein [Ricinus communis]|uniref:VAL1-3 N-terminal zinc finger domain-containing protein n=1 Tax=Ricinus communis TaxID=3988 RepID=B9SYH9_RICCO|nr:conserved hypothetical protein [Ricinus communis]
MAAFAEYFTGILMDGGSVLLVEAVHCGCVMSAHAYIMLDVGGIRCLKCLTSATGGSNQRPKLMMSGETTAKKMVPFRMFL